MNNNNQYIARYSRLISELKNFIEFTHIKWVNMPKPSYAKKYGGKVTSIIHLYDGQYYSRRTKPTTDGYLMDSRYIHIPSMQVKYSKDLTRSYTLYNLRITHMSEEYPKFTKNNKTYTYENGVYMKNGKQIPKEIIIQIGSGGMISEVRTTKYDKYMKKLNKYRTITKIKINEDNIEISFNEGKDMHIIQF